MWKHEIARVGTPHLRRRSWTRSLEFVAALGGVVMLTFALAAVARPAPLRSASRLVDLRAIPESILRRPAVVVLDVDDQAFGELVANPERRGRRWERPATIAFLGDGIVRFDSPVGVRVHGGGSRASSDRSLRLYFRESLGSVVPTGPRVGLVGGGRHESLVLHGDIRRDTGGQPFHYVNPLGYDIARRLGVIAAETNPVTLVLNGGPPKPFVVTEHLNLDFLEARFGHRSFRTYDTKNERDAERLETEGPIAELRARYGAQENWTLERIQRHVDVDNLARWFLLVSFCGTRDEMQGVVVHDDSTPDGKWFWVAWDVDHSFGRRDRWSAPRWSIDQFDRIFSGDPRANPGRNADARVVLLRHLFGSSAPFRRSFAALWTTTRDSLLTQPFLEERLSFYERSAARHGVSDVRYQRDVREFLRLRPAAIQEQLDRLLDNYLD